MIDRDPASRPSVSIIVPVYDNEATIVELVERALRALARVADVRRVVLVDDASTDSSWDRIRELSALEPRVVGLRLASNVGNLSARAVGAVEALGDLVLTLDADLENPPEELPLVLERLVDGCDLVSGVRRDGEGRPIIRQVATRLTRLAVARRWDFVPNDFGCGMKGFRADLLRHAGADLSRYRDVAWAIRLFDGCSAYGEVPIGWDDTDHPSDYRVSRKAAQGVMLLAVLHPGLERRLALVGRIMAALTVPMLLAGRGHPRLALAPFSLGLVARIAAGSLRSASPAVPDTGPPFVVSDRCGGGAGRAGGPDNSSALHQACGE